LLRHGEKYGLDFARAAIQEFNVKITVVGDEEHTQETAAAFMLPIIRWADSTACC
jgi:hypothetical protein